MIALLALILVVLVIGADGFIIICVALCRGIRRPGFCFRLVLKKDQQHACRI